MGEATITRKVGFLKGLRAEFRKIIWPKFSVLMKQTWTVIFVSLVVGAIVTLIDMLYDFGLIKILGL